MSKTQVSWNDYLVAIGKLMSNTTATEVYMYSAFHVLCGCEPPLSRAIFYTLDAFPARKNLINRVVRAIGDQEDKDIISKILAAVDKSNNQRKEISHSFAYATMTSKDDGPAMLLNPRDPGKGKRVSKEYLAQLVQNSLDALHEASHQYECLCQKHERPAQPIFE